MEQNKITFGTQVKKLLQQQGISQRQLATKLAISPSTLNNYLADKREPDFDTLVDIATSLDTSIDFLLNYTPPHVETEKSPLLAKFESELLPLTHNMTVGQLELILKHAKILSNYSCEKILSSAVVLSSNTSNNTTSITNANNINTSNSSNTSTSNINTSNSSNTSASNINTSNSSNTSASNINTSNSNNTSTNKLIF